MHKHLITFLLLSAMLHVKCDKPDKNILFQNEKYTLYTDKVVQGDFSGIAISPVLIASDYNLPHNNQYPRLIEFKFSVNQEDNELPPGINHWIIIDTGHFSPMIKFGEPPERLPIKPTEPLPFNYPYTFRLNISPLLEQFEEKGFYKAPNGNKTMKADFEGVYIAGASLPMNWRFENLKDQGLQLKQTDEENIYEITLILNPLPVQQQKTENTWQLKTNIADKPKYISDQLIVDALYNLALEEAIKAIEPDSTLRTGAKWAGVWTRDISYSIFLAFAIHEPEVAMNSLRKKVNRGRIVQDTGSGGAYPVSSDRTIWAIAAWELYKVTGNEKWLKEAYQVIKNTLEDDYEVLKGPETGLYKGESSFLDWREQSYPNWMDNADIYNSENLGTNVVHYQAHKILSQMALKLGRHHVAERYQAIAANLKQSINKHFWIKDKGYYGQYLYGRCHLNLSKRPEALGESLAILFSISDKRQSKSIIENYPNIPYGTSCFYPQVRDIPAYHNNGVWPFVQAHWNLASAKAGNENALNHGLASIYRPAALFLSNYENFVAENGDFSGTEINSHRMLWSIAGNLAMVYRVFMGMSFEPDGITFAPVVPKSYSGNKRLQGLKYRNSTLNIEVKGFGKKVKAFTLDGESRDTAFFPASLKGAHDIVIELNNTSFGGKMNLVPNHSSLKCPELHFDGNKIDWTQIKGARLYKIYKNGAFLKEILKNNLIVNPLETAEYKVSVIDSLGWESFTSEPLLIHAKANSLIIEMEDFVKKSDLPYTGYTGNGFIEITPQLNKAINIPVEVHKDGSYFLLVKYSNGSGPWNTDNKCAFRDLIINGSKTGTLVFPQRGDNKWNDWGWSNCIRVKLKKGNNKIGLEFNDWNNNMDFEVNKAMLDCIKLIRITD